MGDRRERGRSREGRAAIFCVVDHASGEAWADAAMRMDRFAAADLLREVCTERFGSVERAIASGLVLRYDGGSCFRSDHYQTESTCSPGRDMIALLSTQVSSEPRAPAAAPRRLRSRVFPRTHLKGNLITTGGATGTYTGTISFT